MNLERLVELEEAGHFWSEGRRRLLTRLIKQLSPKNILDIGCGSGALLANLSASGVSITGVDIDAGAIDYCRGRLPEATFKITDAADLPFEDGIFDLVLALDILEHHDNDYAPLSEAARVLQSGGKLVASVPAWRRLYGRHDREAGHLRRYGRAEFLNSLTAAGFRVARVNYFNFFLFPVLLVSRGLSLRESRPPAIVNRLFGRVIDIENSLFPHIAWPWGSSLIAIGEKPHV